MNQMPDTDRNSASTVPGMPAWLETAWQKLPGAMPVQRASVDADAWVDAALHARRHDARLVALWGVDRRNAGAGFAVIAAYGTAQGLACLDLAIDASASSPGYPDLSGIFPSAVRMQRAISDLCGLVAQGASDRRPWLRHAGWPVGYLPLRREPSGRERFAPSDETYDFVRVEGEGVHEIPVGPVHAGIIEPGHFRFSVVGEKVLRLEERLGYVHKGIEKRFEGLEPGDGARLAGRVSGDTTVAYAWAWAMAVESLCDVPAPARAAHLRAIALERERIANHLGDLGALGNDAGFALGLAQFSRLREDWLRANARAQGHRLLMDFIVPGGVASDLSAHQANTWRAALPGLQREVEQLQAIYDEHSGLQDRFVSTGRLDTDLARRLGVTGLAARASGIDLDLRKAFGPAPYPDLGVRTALSDGGDVAARVAVRFQEVMHALAMLDRLLASIPSGACRAELPVARADSFACGWIEGWRGEVLVAIETDDRARIRRAHCHDPSWQNWPALEHAVPGNIVPDFPLINKSFNLSYSGQDL